MDIDTLCDDFATAIADDDTLTSWCATNYSALRVFINIDTRKPPVPKDGPFVALWPVSKNAGENRATVSHTIEVVCALSDTAAETVNDNDAITKYAGVGNIAAMRRMVEDAIVGVDISNAEIPLVDSQFDTIEDFPMFFCSMIITISNTNLIGADPFG